MEDTVTQTGLDAEINDTNNAVQDAAQADAVDVAADAPAADVNADDNAAADNVAADNVAADNAADEQTLPPERKKGLRAWWARHKPSKRRLIQIYAMLLYNANIRGFISGDIFTGATKVACVPGLNCYSCPGAVGACPLGALQNALASTGARAPYYVFGIILLYGLIFARTVCGWLCPMGLGQDLLYKIRSPKLKKNRVTKVLSYLKYVILAVLVVGIPVVYAIDQTAVPGFCKYICPAGAFEGAIMLLLHPSNDSMFTMLGALFSWKTVVLVCVLTASIFIYRFFCRFLCPLGALYGLFNRFALLGIKVNKSKCTNCGKCVDKCKMDITKVGDHECISCGDCVDVCPTKAITWKGSKVFMKNVDDSVVPVATVTEKAPTLADVAVTAAPVPKPASAPAPTPATSSVSAPAAVAAGPKRDRAFWTKVVAIVLAALLFVGVFTYVNFFAAAGTEATYDIVVNTSKEIATGKAEYFDFAIGDSTEYIDYKSGSGTKDDPYIIKSIEGIYSMRITDAKEDIYFRYTASKAKEYTVTTDYAELELRVYYVFSDVRYSMYDYRVDGDKLKLDLKQPGGYGCNVGDKCYDFTLSCYNGKPDVKLSDFAGKTVLINFWATWCGPCVNELPAFESVCNANDDVVVIAIHSASVTDEVQPFIDSKGWRDWNVLFAQDLGDAKDSKVYTMLGGRNGAYPRTLVVDPAGVITKVFNGSVTENALLDAIKA